MTRKSLLKKLGLLSDKEFARVAPFIEADLASIDGLEELHREIEEGRRSAKREPLLDAKEVYARVRAALAN